jgi:hypothetical protein
LPINEVSRALASSRPFFMSLGASLARISAGSKKMHGWSGPAG